MATARRRRKPTTWATPDTVEKALQDMKSTHLRCRAMRHHMDVKPNSYRYNESGQVVITIWCIRCQDYERDIIYDATTSNILERKSARYDGGYVLKGVGRIGSDVGGMLFEEIVQTELRAEVKRNSRRKSS